MERNYEDRTVHTQNRKGMPNFNITNRVFTLIEYKLNLLNISEYYTVRE